MDRTQFFKDIRKKSTNIYHYLAVAGIDIKPVARRDELHKATKAENKRKEDRRRKKEMKKQAKLAQQQEQEQQRLQMQQQQAQAQWALPEVDPTRGMITELVDLQRRLEATKADSARLRQLEAELQEREEAGDMTDASTASTVSVRTPTTPDRPRLRPWNSEPMQAQVSQSLEHGSRSDSEEDQESTEGGNRSVARILSRYGAHDPQSSTGSNATQEDLDLWLADIMGLLQPQGEASPQTSAQSDSGNRGTRPPGPPTVYIIPRRRGLGDPGSTLRLPYLPEIDTGSSAPPTANVTRIVAPQPARGSGIDSSPIVEATASAEAPSEEAQRPKESNEQRRKRKPAKQIVSVPAATPETDTVQIQDGNTSETERLLTDHCPSMDSLNSSDLQLSKTFDTLDDSDAPSIPPSILSFRFAELNQDEDTALPPSPSATGEGDYKPSRAASTDTYTGTESSSLADTVDTYRPHHAELSDSEPDTLLTTRFATLRT